MARLKRWWRKLGIFASAHIVGIGLVFLSLVAASYGTYEHGRINTLFKVKGREDAARVRGVAEGVRVQRDRDALVQYRINVANCIAINTASKQGKQVIIDLTQPTPILPGTPPDAVVRIKFSNAVKAAILQRETGPGRFETTDCTLIPKPKASTR